MFTHNIYRCLRVRMLIVRDGKLLILPRPDAVGGDPPQPGAVLGGGVEPNETLFEAGEREVLEESGLRVKAKSVAFLTEWVVPKHWPLETTREMLLAHGLTEEQTRQSDHAYGLEVYLWAELAGDSAEPDRADLSEGPLKWVPFAEVEKQPLFPAELRALARRLAAGERPAAVPIFTSGLGDPWDQPDYDAFRRVQDSRPHP